MKTWAKPKEKKQCTDDEGKQNMHMRKKTINRVHMKKLEKVWAEERE